MVAEVVGRPEALELQALELEVATPLAEQAPDPPAHLQAQALEVVVVAQLAAQAPEPPAHVQLAQALELVAQALQRLLL